jgi:type IV pilus assembly protein PilO
MAGQLDAQKILQWLETLPNAYRHGLFAALSVGIVGVYGLTWLPAVHKDLTGAKQQLAKLQGEIAEAKAVVANLDTFRARSEELGRKYQTARERLPNATELPVLLTDISSLGKKSGLDFRRFRPEPEVKRGFYAEVPIAVSFFGSYHEIGVFFDRLSKLSRIVNVTQFSMKLQREGGEAPTLSVSGIATTFRFIETEEKDAKEPETKEGG